MARKKKYVMPDTSELEGAGPQVAELIAFTAALTDSTNAVYEEVLALEAEVRRLKKPRSADCIPRNETASAAMR